MLSTKRKKAKKPGGVKTNQPCASWYSTMPIIDSELARSATGVSAAPASAASENSCPTPSRPSSTRSAPISSTNSGPRYRKAACAAPSEAL